MSKWIRMQLGQVGSFSTSSVDKKSEANQQPVRLVNYMNVYRQHTIDASSELMEVTANSVEIARSQVLPGDILFTPSSETPDDIGHSAVVAEGLLNTLHSYHTVRMRPHSKDFLDIRFSAWFCNSNNVRKQFEQKCAGSTRYTLSIPAFRSTFVEIPESLVEQKKIASYLDVIDQAIGKTEALIDKYQQIKAGLMRDLFTRGIGPDGQLRPPREQAPGLYQETPIGWIPKEWEIRETGELCMSIVPGRNKPKLKGGELPWITVADLGCDYVYESLLGLSLSREELSAAQGRTIPEGAVIMSCVGSFGEVAIAGKELVVNQQLHGFVAGATIIPEWLAYSLERQKTFMEKIATQTTILYLNKSGCESIPVVLPPIEEQEKIVKKIKGISSKIASEGAFRTKLAKQKSGLLHDLLTGKVQVEPETESEAAYV